MSSHTLDVAGGRGMQVTLNDPSVTKTWIAAKQGEDMAVTLGGAREFRFALPPSATIQRRKYVRKVQLRTEGGGLQRGEGGEVLTQDEPYDALVLVMSGSATIFGRVSNLEEEGAFENYPHSQVSAKRWSDLHFLESGELKEEISIGEVALDAPGRKELLEGARQLLVELGGLELPDDAVAKLKALSEIVSRG